MSYLDHCRIQHNMRFATLSYSLVLASIITFVTTTVEIIYPDRLATPVFAATLTVNSNGTDDDGSCFDADCTFKEALGDAVDGDTISFQAGLTIQTAVGFDETLFSVSTNNLTIDGNGTVIEDTNDNEAFGNADAIDAMASGVSLSNFSIQGFGDNCVVVDDINFIGSDLTVQDCDYGIQINADSDGATLSNITSNGNTLYGLLDEGATGVTITNSSFNDNTTGVSIEEGSSNTEVSGNTITDNETGVIINNADDTEISNNTLLSNGADIQIVGADPERTLISGNTTDQTDIEKMIDYATDPIDPPTITTQTTTTLAGTTTANATVDIYQLSADTGYVTYLDATIADANGAWEFTSSDFNTTTVYLTATTAAGTSPFIAEAHPSIDLAISNITATVLSASEASISWDTSTASNSRVRYGTSTDALSSKVENDNSVTEHKLKLTGLSANTTYYYQVRSEDANSAVTSDTQSFTTEADEDPTLAEDAETVAQTVTVDYENGGNTTVVGNGSTTTTFPFGGDLTFIFNDIDGGINNYGGRLHFVLREAKKNAQAIIDKKKAFDAAGEARFKVKQQQLSKEKTYAVLSGVIKQDGSYFNTTGLAKRFTFTLRDIPQLIYPSNTEIFYRMPEEFIITSKAPSVTVYIDNANGEEVLHCTAVMAYGIGSCRPPFHVPGLGEYTIRLVDSRGGIVSESILFSDIAPNETITTDVRSANFYKRIIFGGNPTLAGLVGTGNTIEIHIPQIDGPMYAAVTGNSWVFMLTLTTLSYGATEFTVIERQFDGTIVNQDYYLVYRSYRPVVPAVIAPENNSSATTAPTIQVIGPDDHTLEIFNSEKGRLFLGDFVNGGRTVDLSSWFSNTGTYTITLQNRNSLNIPSAPTTFTFTITAPTTVFETTPTETITETDNTNSSNNTNTPPEADQPMADTTNTNQTNTNSSNTNTTNANTNSSTTDQTQPDTDGDGLSDVIEELVDTDPTNPDTNEDDINDYDELIQDPGTDSDSDGLKIVDTDKDGLADSEEPFYGTDPNDPDTDGDNMSDGDEVMSGFDPLTADGDADGLTDPQEYASQTDPRRSDTDSDGMLDGAEVSNQTSPIDPDSDDDDLSDNELVDYGTDALDADSDNDGLLDGEEIDRSCDPLNVDSDGDKIDDLAEALAGTDCSSIDNLWSNLSSIEAYLQEQANTVGVNYPLITHQIVPPETDLDKKLTKQITTATALDIIPGAKTVVSDGTIRVITQTTEISVVDWLTGQNSATTDNTYVLVSGTVSLPDSVRGQPAYVLVTFFSTPMVKIAQVDGNGQWTMTVPAELLTTGEHTALAALEVNGTRSEQVEVAKFVINHKRKLSSTSWLVIVNVVVAILALLIAVIVHLRRKRSDESYA